MGSLAIGLCFVEMNEIQQWTVKMSIEYCYKSVKLASRRWQRMVGIDQ